MAVGRIGVIACGVLEWNIERIRARRPDRQIVLRVLPAQLHNNPHRLRELLQEAVDELETLGSLDGIVIGYGLCGRGTIGLMARTVPLVLPRVQDCIGAFLGSNARHMAEFARHPGTRYLTHGWYCKTVGALGAERFHTARNDSLYGSSYEDLAKRYGVDNAQFICAFRESWKRNYSRSAYIGFDGEAEDAPGRRAAQALACELGWMHDVLAGDESLLEAMLSGDWHDPRLLVVPPGNKTVSAPGEAVFGFAAGIDSHVEALLARYESGPERGAPCRSGIGLGIDTGGTYTDAVIFDFDANRVLAQTKAPTTHGCLIEGIRAALAKLPVDAVRRVGRVGLSTTLATNAFVEGKGRPVALFVMSRFAIDPEQLPFRFVRHLRGSMSIDGSETEPVDEAEVRAAARAALAAGCEAIAVSGFAGVINPAHELAVGRIAFEETGLHAVCGHELSTRLNFIERATTAAMNARLIPLIEDLIDAVAEALAEHGLREVRTMIVKGDGSQLLAAVARQLPVETVLSGPAASAVGAARLFGGRDAVVVDMGGTTLDVARLHRGFPALSDNGAMVGGFRTSVRAMEAQTIGLGGDSEIDLSGWPEVRLGPRRVIPFCRLGESQPAQVERLPEALRDVVSRARNATDLVALAPGAAPAADRLLVHLADGPLLLATLARRMDRPSPDYVPWHDLESRGLVRRYGLTLTDILHLTGKFTAFDSRPAAAVAAHWCLLLETDLDTLVARVLHEFRRLVIDTVLQVALPGDCPWHEGEALRRWITARMADEDLPVAAARVRADLRIPVIAVGAPVSVLFPSLAPLLGNEVLISEYAPVANAIGAIAGDVLLRETATVRVRDDGAFVCSWRGGAHRAASLQAALETCEEALRAILRRDAEANRVTWVEPRFHVNRHEADTRDGSLFLGLTLTAEMRG